MKAFLYSVLFVGITSVTFVFVFDAIRLPGESREEPDSVGVGNDTPASQQALPTFTTYPVSPRALYQGEPAPVDFASAQGAEQFSTRLVEGAREGPNFAGRYTVVTWGCGTSCQVSAIIDAQTGKIVEYGLVSTLGLAYRLESELLSVNPPDEPVPPPLATELSRDYYRMQEGELVHLKKQTASGDVVDICPALTTVARNPVTGAVREFSTPCAMPSGWERQGGPARVHL